MTLPIEVKNLTKDYGFSRGVFDISFHVEKGEVFGFLGPNGAGKTTAIRHIMGFSKPQSGQTFVLGMNSWEKSDEISKTLGYLPGEIALPQSLTGRQFLKYMAHLRGLTDMSKTEYLLEKFDLDPSGTTKRMPLGEKRKLAIVAAFMHDPDILVLDEPTSGLDPLMQETFIDFISEEKKNGKTILLSSHIFKEVDATCDRIAIIKDGHIVTTVKADELRHNNSKTFKIEFLTKSDFDRFVSDKQLMIVAEKPDQNQVKVHLPDAEINRFFDVMSEFDLKFISEIKFTLQDFFMDFYDKNKSADKGVESVREGLSANKEESVAKASITANTTGGEANNTDSGAIDGGETNNASNGTTDGGETNNANNGTTDGGETDSTSHEGGVF